MRPTIFLLSAAVCLGLMATDVSWAQVVRIGPQGEVRIRAPFVRVDVGPNGETSVRAPFTAVDTPGGRLYQRYGVFGRRPTGPTLADPSMLDRPTLWRMLQSGVSRLQRELDRLSTGEGWKRHLQTDTLNALAAGGNDQPLDPETIEHLQVALEVFDAVSQTPGYRRISSLHGFQVTHAALGELSLAPKDRARRRLAGRASELERQLSRLTTGPGWIKYLRLPDEVFAEPGAVDPAAPVAPGNTDNTEATLGKLINVLVHYDEVSNKQQYRVIARLPSFQPAHEQLIEYVRLLSKELPNDPLREPQVETMPAPVPEGS